MPTYGGNARITTSCYIPFLFAIGNGNCLVNASDSMNIKLFEWYKPHSLHDSPEPTVADQRVKQRG